MNDLFNMFFRLFNGITTLVLAALLYNIYRKTTRRFYAYWSVGYILYSINIFVRIRQPHPLEMTTAGQYMIGYVAFFFSMSGFLFNLLGVGELVKRKRLLVSIILILYPIFVIANSLYGEVFVILSTMVLLAPYLYMVLSLSAILLKYDIDITKILVGWTILLLANIGWLTYLVDSGFVDLLSIYGKIIIFFGCIQPGFSFLVDDISRFLISGIPTEYSNEKMGTFNLLNLTNAQRKREVEWIKNRARENSRKGIRSIVIVLHDMITPHELLDDEDTGEDLYLVRMIQGNRSQTMAFDEKIISIKDDLNQLDIMFSDIINISNERKLPCEIILYTLSVMIHTHGWKRVYTFVTSKFTGLRHSQVNLTTFYYPETHQEISEIKKFESMANEIITR